MSNDSYDFVRREQARLWTGHINQHTADRLDSIKSGADYAISSDDMKFLIRLCHQLYREDRLTGDQMRNMAQCLDIMVDDAEVIQDLDPT